MAPKIALPRRTFLKAAAGFSGASLFGGMSFKAFAQATALAPANRCFVFAYFQGGWDILLSLDPRDPTQFNADRLAETRIQPGYEQLTGFPTTVVQPPGSNIAFGPAIGRMADHFDVMSVVRGINMSTVAHDVGYRYFLTGKSPIGSAARGSSTATEIVGQMRPNVPVPSIAYNIETYNDRYPGAASALKVSNQNDLLLTLAPSPTALDSEIERQLVTLQGKPVRCEADLYDSRGLVTQYGESRAQMESVIRGGLDKNFTFANKTPDDGLNAVRAEIRTKYRLSATDNGTVPGSRAALVAQALKLGISQCVSINITGGLDTHFGTQTVHATRQSEGWNALGDLVTDLKGSAHPAGGNWMDHTTIVVFSEFSRTPLINASGGRDHHLTNACMLLGAGIKHNAVFGRSGNVGLSAGLFDYRTGEPRSDGLPVGPEHVLATVLQSANLDYSILRCSHLPGLLAS